ncbi:MAG: hypothetical protein QXO71_02430 [Candidatus Jordarchaeaceae archaeon]
MENGRYNEEGPRAGWVIEKIYISGDVNFFLEIEKYGGSCSHSFLFS